MNEVVALHRQAVPNDPRSDAELTLGYGDNYLSGYSQYPQFVKDYTDLSAQRKAALTPSLPAEFARGVSRGVSSLEGTGYGALGLASGAVGADAAKNYFLQRAQDKEQESAANPPTVPNIEDAQGPEDVLRYGLGKAGELVPNVVEAGVTGLAGAVAGGAAGTAAEPGVGTAVGAGGGFLYGLLERQAVKTLIKQAAEKGVEIGEQSLTKDAVAQTAKALGQKYGTHLAETVNFWAQSSGSTYNTLSKNPDVDPGTAINVSLFGGLAQAVPAQFLPSYALGKFFGPEAKATGPYFLRLAHEAGKVVPGGVAAMDLQELASIASEKYADPKTREQAFDVGDWTKEDRSRLVNASLTGGLAGALGAVVGAIPKGKVEPEAPKVPDAMKAYTGDLKTPEGRQMVVDMASLAAREIKGETGLNDRQTIDAMTPEQRNAYLAVKADVARQVQTQAEPPKDAAVLGPDISQSDLGPVTERLRENPSPLVPHPEFSDKELLGAIATPEPQQPGTAGTADQGPAGVKAAEPQLIPAPTAATSPQLAAARAAAIAGLQEEPAATTLANPQFPKPIGDQGVTANAQGSGDLPKGLSGSKQGNGVINIPPNLAETLGSVGNTPALHSPPDAIQINSELLGDVIKTSTLLDKGYGSLDVPTRSAVLNSVLALIKDDEVFRRVVSAIPVDVMHKLMGKEFPSEYSLHDKAMLIHALSSDHNLAVRGDAIDAIVRSPALSVAKVSGIGLPPGDIGSAGVTDTSDTSHSNIDTSHTLSRQIDLSNRPDAITLSDINFEGNPLTSRETGKGANRNNKGAGLLTKDEPAIFDIHPDELKDPGELGRRLVAGSSSRVQTDAYQKTKRMTALLDNETGKVQLVGTFKDKKADEVRLVDPAKVGNRKYSSRLDEILGAKTAAGETKWTPIASVELKNPRHNYSETFASRQAFDERVGAPAKVEQLRQAHEAAKYEEALRATTGADKSNLPHTDDQPTEEQGGTESEPEHPEAAAESGGGVFTDEHLHALQEVFSGEKTVPTASQFNADFMDRISSDPVAKAGVLEAVRDEMATGKSPMEALAVVQEKLYESVKAGFTGGPGAFEESARKSFAGEATGATGHSEPSPAPAAGLKPAEQQSQGGQGAPVANPAALKFRQPEGVQTVTTRHADLLDNIHQAAQAGGLNLEVIGHDLTGMAGDFAKRTGAAYDQASRTISQVVADVIGREDVITSLHEVAHDVFAQLPPQVRYLVTSAIDRMSDRALGVDISADPRIRQGNPLNLPNIGEERLVEATALRLTDQGFDPKQAQGWAQSFVRALKDLYTRAAMAIQRSLLGEQFVNPELAQRFFENRMKQFLAGDFNRSSFMDVLGGGKPSDAKVATWHAPAGNPLFERMGDNGRPEYGHVPDIDLDNARFNTLKFRQPDMDPRKRTVEVEKQAALANHTIDIIGDVIKSPELQRVAAALKVAPEKALLDLLNLTNPTEIKTRLNSALESNETPVRFNPDKKLADFKSKSEAADANNRAYINDQALLTRAAAVKSRSQQDVTRISRQRERLIERSATAKEQYANWQDTTTWATKELRSEAKELFKSIAGTSKRQGVFEQQLRQLDPTANLRKYLPEFQKLFTGKQLDGENLFQVLDRMANDPKIDFKDNVSEIRDAMREDTEGHYGKFIGNDRESIALLSSVVGFAKLHQREMASLELRRSPDAKERVAIAGRMEQLNQEKTDLLKNFKELGRNASTEERLRLAHRKANKEVVSANRRIEKAKQRITAADALTDVVAREHAKLAAKQDIAAGAVFRDGMPYPVPENPKVSSAELFAKLKGQDEGPSQWSHKAIAVDTSRPDEVRDSKAVQEDLRKMSAFLDERETRAQAGDEHALDSAYLGVKRNFEEIAAHVNFDLRVAPSDKFMFELGMTPAGIQVEDGIGTPAARSMGMRVRRAAALRFEMNSRNEKIWETSKHLEDKLLRLLPAKLNEAREYLHENFLNPAKALFETSDDLEERHAGNPEALVSAVMNRVMNHLLDKNAATTEYVKGHEAEWRAGLQKLLEHHHESGQWQLSFLEKNRMGVTDERTKTIDVATGKEVSAVRAHVPKGTWTFQRSLARDVFNKMVTALRGSGWGGDEQGSNATADFKTIGELYNSGPDGPAKAAQLVAKYFQHPDHGQQVQETFFKNLALMESRSPFEAPRMADGVTRPPADIGLVHAAYDLSQGDAVKFFEAMYDMHGGQDIPGEEGQPPIQNKGIFVQEGMQKLASLATRADNMLRDISPDPTVKEAGIKGMFANALIDARTIEDLPSQWFSYHTLDQRDVYKTGERIAAEIAFGRSGEGLQADAETVQREIAAAQQKIAEARDRARAKDRFASARKIQKQVEQEVGSEVSKIAARGKLLQRTIGDLSAYYLKDNSPDGTLNAISRWANLLGALMVNQPSSALSQLAPLVDLNLRYGVGKSALRATVDTIKEGGKEIAGSLAQAVGLQMFNGGENARMWHELNLGDPGVIRKATDGLSRLPGEGTPAFAARATSGLLGVGINPLGDKAQHTVFRPLQPFNTAYTAVNKAITFGTWNIAKKYLMNGMEFYRNHLDKLNDPDFKLTPENLGLRRFEKDSFGRFHGDLARWGMNYDAMVREAMQRPDNTVLTNDQATRLYGMAMTEISLESSLASRPAAGFNNPWLRAALPLLGWSFARARQVFDLRLNPEGRMEMRAFIGGMAGLAVVTGGGLAVSTLIDQYYERLLGKQRNLRPLFGSSDPQELALSVLENTNRIGTLGMFGELANSVLNVGAGGDNRVLSVDQRVVAISSLQSIMQAGSAFFNQGFNADYAHVIRPFFSATGGGGLLQYMQLANNALGLDNAEARVTARINAQNYLRVVGRELQMDVRVPDGSSSNPTPITPFLTNMELAAYKNAPGDFQQAYAQAVAAAKAQGNPDPVDYVKRAFSGRNPLRSVFRTAISEPEYHRLLANMPGSGGQDVSQAVNLFNHYAERIGAKPFDGKTEKPSSTAKPFSQAEARARAVTLQ